MKPGKTAVQGLVIPVAYELGRQCPVGLEDRFIDNLEQEKTDG